MQFKHLSKPPGNSRSLLTISMLRIINQCYYHDVVVNLKSIDSDIKMVSGIFP
jgi:hypothetical protein